MSANEAADNADIARVGFVVIGRNEGERLVRCLDSLGRAGAVEIVYVDSASTDKSVEEAEARQARVVRLDLSRPFTAGRARNEGFEALVARAPQLQFVQFVDGDCELVPEWLPSALAFMGDRPDVAVACGRRQERNPGASRYNKLCDMEWNTPIGEANACGGDSLVRAAAFREVGGFSNQLIAGEEPELCHRLRARGGKIWRLDLPMTLHDAAMYRFGQWWMRGVRSGFGYAQVWTATRAGAQPLYGLEIRRALFWAGLIPLAAVMAALASPWLGAAIATVYGVQIARIAMRLGPVQAASWSYGLFAVLAKFPELQGILRYGLVAARGGQRSAILYK
jgi:glycosyltransferase involved in cell wall biosynthesis